NGGPGTVTVYPPPILDNSDAPLEVFAPIVSVTIPDAAGSGVTTLNLRADLLIVPKKPGYQLGSPPYYYDLFSTAVPGSGQPYTICIGVDGMSFADRVNVRMYFYDGAQWVDATFGPTSGPEICGQRPALGLFALMHPGAASN